jgi:hypothetical protein
MINQMCDREKSELEMIKESMPEPESFAESPVSRMLSRTKIRQMQYKPNQSRQDSLFVSGNSASADFFPRFFVVSEKTFQDCSKRSVICFPFSSLTIFVNVCFCGAAEADRTFPSVVPVNGFTQNFDFN